MYDPDLYSVISKKGDLVVIERGETLLKRNVGHVKRFIEQRPQASEPQQLGIQPVEQPLVQQPVLEPATLPYLLTYFQHGKELSQAGLRTMLLERLS